MSAEVIERRTSTDQRLAVAPVAVAGIVSVGYLFNFVLG